MKKNWISKLLGLLAVGAAIGAAIAYFTNNYGCCEDDDEDEFSDDFEDEDFDLDEDLKEVPTREYVSLTPETIKKEEETVQVEVETEVDVTEEAPAEEVKTDAE